MENFTRHELQDIRDRAVTLAMSIPNKHWQWAYEQLADAADKLDAMVARTEDK